MAGAMRRMAEYLGLVDDDGRFEDAEIVEDDHRADARPARRGSPAGDHPDDYGAAYEEPAADVATLTDRRNAASARPIHTVGPAAKERAELSRITTLHPRTFNDARVIGEHFRDGTPVIMNLTSMDDSDARRLVDFAAGLIFGLRGSLDKVATKVFLLTPADVEVTAEDKRRLVETEFFNQS